MTNKSREQVRRELELIRKLMEDKNLSDNEIIQQLKITEPTFYRYKRRLRKIYTKTWETMNRDNTKYAYAKLNNTLEYCYRETKKIIDSPDSKATDKIEAIKALDVIASQMAKLSKHGPIFTPSLPNNKVIEVEGKEINI